MRIVNAEMLRRFREATRCELCGEPCRHGCHPPHIRTRGSGRLDITINLISLCPDGVGESCHRKFHDGNLPIADILSFVAHREGTEVDYVIEAIDFIRRIPAWVTKEVVAEMIDDELGNAVARLVRRSLRESAIPDL